MTNGCSIRTVAIWRSPKHANVLMIKQKKKQARNKVEPVGVTREPECFLFLAEEEGQGVEGESREGGIFKRPYYLC